MSGYVGSASAPAADTSTWARNSPAVVVTCQRRVASSQRAEVTSAPNTQCSRTPNRSAVACRYAWISGCSEYERGQSGFWAKENE